MELWANSNSQMPGSEFQYKASGKSIPYEELGLERAWETFDIQHELTRKESRNLLLITEQRSLAPRKRDAQNLQRSRLKETHGARTNPH